MDQELLVDNRIDDATRLIAQLERDGFKVSIAFWIRTEEEGVWHLYLASPAVVPEKPGDAFRLLYASFSRLPDLSIPLSSIKLINSENSVAKHALTLRDRHRGRQPLLLKVDRFATLPADEVFIYPRAGEEDVRGSHRHLIGIVSPPSDHQPDNLTLGPNLPLGWDGDAWMRQRSDGNSYWLRAWNKQTGQYAVAQANRYEDARRLLLTRIAEGGSGRVDVKVVESKSDLFLTPSHDEIRTLAKEKIEFAYSNARDRGITDPVVFTLDLRDENARWVAELMAPEQDINAALNEASQRKTMPTLTFSLPRKQAEKVVAKLEPTVAKRLEATPTPPGQYLSIVVAEGQLSGRGLTALTGVAIPTPAAR